MLKHHHLIHILQNRELDELYASLALRAFALGMITIFIPVYLVELGYEVATVLFWYGVIFAIHVAAVIPAAQFASRFGFKHAIFASVPILVVFYVLLYSLEQYNWPLIVIALLAGITNALFWMGLHLDFAKFTSKGRRGREMGTARIVVVLFQSLGPIVGGTIAAFFGFKVLFVVVTVLLFASIAPLFFSHDIHEPIMFSVKNIFKNQSWRDTASFVAHGVDNSMLIVLWPLVMFLALESYTEVGFVASLSLAIAVPFMALVGRLTDSYQRAVLRVGAVANAFIWFLKSLLTTLSQFAVIDAVHGLVRSVVMIPFTAMAYDKAADHDMMEYVTRKEIMINLGKMMFFFVTAFFFTQDIGESFLLWSMASLGYLLF